MSRLKKRKGSPVAKHRPPPMHLKDSSCFLLKVIKVGWSSSKNSYCSNLELLTLENSVPAESGSRSAQPDSYSRPNHSRNRSLCLRAPHAYDTRRPKPLLPKMP